MTVGIILGFGEELDSGGGGGGREPELEEILGLGTVGKTATWGESVDERVFSGVAVTIGLQYMVFLFKNFFPLILSARY